MNPQALDKARAHAEHLLDLLIELKHKLALLNPLLPGEAIARTAHAGPQSKGLAVLRFALFGSCLPRAPSVANIIPVFEDLTSREQLKSEFCLRFYAGAGPDRDIRLVLERLSLEQGGDPRRRFDDSVARLLADWAHLRAVPQLQACKTIRDQLVAHTDLRFVDGSYQLLDVGPMGLHWTDLGPLTGQLEDCVSLINLLIRSAGFDFDGLDGQLRSANQRMDQSGPDV
jgi:hypothetical protein